GYIDTAPAGPFDGATSLLTLHFLDIEDRIDTVRQIAARLKPGAPLVVVHQSFPQQPEERARWLERYEAFARANGVPGEMAQGARQGVGAMTTLLEPEQDMDVLRSAGLTGVSPFYRAFAWSGWFGYAPG
ncbi:MAG: class I SAM-dependent methyltransferase, partial [Pseudomonadota bacterium]